ncbi:hypothetical protein [Paracoccus sp. IB05]|uniref:hypothetical protein n=1 Tax=Paracoccus sp. IB05 TaxID=2779367 RepID=UPI0018E83B82|nr:hypothetical protein [Paracoccus sp. IB05]MBJ2149843.1 hypothetical protein [Paracoccus sp. IB05]
MVTIVGRPRKDVTTAYVAQITRRGHGVQETRSFDRRITAKALAKKTEVEIDDVIAEGLKLKTTRIQRKTLGDAIARYVEQSVKVIGKTKTQVLRTIRKDCHIADKRRDQIDSVEIVWFAQELRNRPGLASPVSVLNYLSHLPAAFTRAPALWGFDPDPREMEKAMVRNTGDLCKRAQLQGHWQQGYLRPWRAPKAI